MDLSRKDSVRTVVLCEDFQVRWFDRVADHRAVVDDRGVIPISRFHTAEYDQLIVEVDARSLLSV